MYRVFRFLLRFWIAAGSPAAGLVRWVRHDLLGRYWPPVCSAPLPAYMLKRMEELKNYGLHTVEASTLVVIPTSGQHLEQLQQCIASVQMNASDSIAIDLQIVVSPSSEETLDRVQSVAPHDAQVIPLPAPFNYVTSINTAFEHLDEHTHVLLLNDDCYLQSANVLQALVQSMQQYNCACIGPWIVPPEYTKTLSHSGFRYTLEPVNGCCALWDSKWLEKVGEFDEQFGLGYGFDTSDQILRARNAGAWWGVDFSVRAEHEEHATFGKSIRRSQKFTDNLKRWKQKHPGIPFQAISKDWHPMEVY